LTQLYILALMSHLPVYLVRRAQEKFLSVRLKLDIYFAGKCAGFLNFLCLTSNNEKLVLQFVTNGFIITI